MCGDGHSACSYMKVRHDIKRALFMNMHVLLIACSRSTDAEKK